MTAYSYEDLRLIHMVMCQKAYGAMKAGLTEDWRLFDRLAAKVYADMESRPEYLGEMAHVEALAAAAEQ